MREIKGKDEMGYDVERNCQCLTSTVSARRSALVPMLSHVVSTVSVSDENGVLQDVIFFSKPVIPA